MKKRVLIITAAVLVLAAALGILFLSPTSAKRPRDYSEYFDLPEPSDTGERIAAAAAAYVAKRPKYKSRYYEGGYPDDGCGVCTDVVAFALMGIDRDLQDEVDRDINARPEAYGIEKPDRNIDFRRVKNLKIFFANAAAAEPLDLDPQNWQAGDIVVFENHIGVVSDRRAKNGMPYIIHHSGRFQRAYEEEILSKRDDIVGHYRVE